MFEESIEELYATNRGSVAQADASRTIVVKLNDWQISFRVREFLAFRRFVNSIDIPSKIFDLSDECDFQAIASPSPGLSKNLTLCELIQLRDVVNGGYFMMELNSILHEVLQPGAEFV